MQSSCPLGSTSPRALETLKILRCGSAKSWRFQEIWQSNQLKLLRWFFSLSTIVIAFWNYFHFRSRHPFVEKKNGLNFYAEKKWGKFLGLLNLVLPLRSCRTLRSFPSTSRTTRRQWFKLGHHDSGSQNGCGALRAFFGVKWNDPAKWCFNPKKKKTEPIWDVT